MDVKTPRLVPIIPNEIFPGELRLEPALESLNASAQTRRKLAWQQALDTEFPPTKHDAWRWLDFSDFPTESFAPGTVSARASRTKLPEGVQLLSFKEFESEQYERLQTFEVALPLPYQDRFAAANRALAKDGHVLIVSAGARLDETITLDLIVNAGGASHSNTWIWLEAGSSARVVLRFKSADKAAALHCGLVQVWVGPDADLELDEVQLLNQKSWMVNHEVAQVQKDGRLHWNYTALGSKKNKVFLTVDLPQPGAEALLKGVYFAGSGQHFNLDTQQNHLAPDTHSDLAFRGAAGGTGKSAWEGMIYVDEAAQRTNAYQSDRNLILSNQADMDAIPGLEICANDVSCSHGATVGRIDEEELFYLQCRGIPRDEGEKLIVEGFFAEILDAIHDEDTREMVKDEINRKFLYKDAV